MNVARLGIRTHTRTVAERLADLRFRPALRMLARGKPDDYRESLSVQQRRTLSKRANDPGAGARALVGRVVELGTLAADSSVLCVGCRNAYELDLFKNAGVGDVVGIDLVSQSEEIIVMDTHEMTFPDDRFDAVYASHSLEHSYDVPTVVSEIARVGRPGAVVGIEVPLGPGASDADRIAFYSLTDLRSAVRSIVDRELWAEKQPARTSTNSQGTPVARLVFRLGVDPR